jgi:16S rRNA (adenine1518-N6/adenine1519-N6)-dimethyltransferase
MRYKKFLGQHFLQDRRILKKIIAAARLSQKDVVLEIGAGRGILTEALLKRAGLVVAIEKDSELCEFLKKKFERTKNVEIICSDVLKLNPASILSPHIPSRPLITPYKIVANIPYYITARLLRTIFGKWQKPKLVVLMLQKEVAERICAKPPKMNLLAVSVQYFANPSIVAYVKRTAFKPQPRVDSVIIKLIPKSSYIERSRDRRTGERFFTAVRTGFKQPRKLLLNNLSSLYGKDSVLKTFDKLGINHLARPGDISLDAWVNLAKNLSTLSYEIQNISINQQKSA